MPKMYTMTLVIENTPAFTTATACSSALTGVGATMAAGSQRCTGITAALPIPNTYSASSIPTAGPVTFPASIPPAAKSTVPATTYVQMIAGNSNTIEVDSKIPM